MGAIENGCIICGGKAGSREHVFPAAFGGRRENKGIYCKTHNEDFGCHVAALLAELDVFNAAIGVRPDRWDDVRPAPVVGPDGETYLMSLGRLEVAPPPNIDERYAEFGEPQDHKFPSMRAASQWMAKQQKNGFKVRGAQAGPPSTQFFTAPARASRTLGEPPFMRALLYLGITFLAHRFPELASSSGLAAAKRELSSDLRELAVAVWWQRPQVLAQLQPNPFAHGHIVAVSVNAVSGSAEVLISLWGAINFGMRLGKVDGERTGLAITFINPLAPRPPDDIEELVEEGRTLTLTSPDDGVAYLREVVSGAVPHPLQSVLDAAGQAQVHASAAALLRELMAAHALGGVQRRDALMAAVDKESQRVLSQIKLGVQSFRRFATDLPTPIHDALDMLYAADPNTPRGIAPSAEAALHVGIAVLAAEFERRLDSGILDEATVASLIAGGEGTQLLFASVAAQVLQSALS